MIRIGMVNYINTAPIYEVWKELTLPEEWQVVEAQPSQLNRLLAAGELDLGFVSSYEYAVRPEQYQIFDDLSISATGPVGSVFLFSTLAAEELGGKTVLLTGQSDTSVCLVRLILEEFLQVKPRYITGDVYQASAVSGEIQAVLAIGDDALRLKAENRYPIRLDLAHCWYEKTGLPFVFAVCAVQNKFLESHAVQARQIRETFIQCRSRGRERFSEICQNVAQRIPMDCEDCSRYLGGIEHDLSPSKLQALEVFYTYLINRQEASGKALPIRIFK